MSAPADTSIFVHRVLPDAPFASLDEYTAAGGGRGLEAARRLGPAAIIEELEASGLRGRGGAGFPTGRKWRTVTEHASSELPATVVVNAAEGEPGTFKDRAILRRNAGAVVEGALIAAHAVGADRVVFALKSSFTEERACLERTISEAERTGWVDGVVLSVVTGPAEYLFGEETALLEVLDGRPPFPRIAPPFRHGVDEVGSDPEEPAGVRMADTEPGGVPPTLVNNVETLANVPGILAESPKWFRSLGTDASPGTVVCTVTGRTQRHGVGEVPIGTPLSAVIEAIGGGPAGQRVVAVLSGVANALVPADLLDTPVSYEHMEAIGSGLGSAGFIVFDDTTDLAAVAAGVSGFLAVESCGQCTPCKQDGLALADLLDRVRQSSATEDDLTVIADRVGTVADEARCFLAQQHQIVLDSVLRLFPEHLRAHVIGQVDGSEPDPILPLRDIVDGHATYDDDQLTKQPDWTFEPTDSGKTPVERLG